jgi:hypothetical protein
MNPDVVMVYGFWGQNIGNAFFNVGGEWVLGEAFDRHYVGKIQDQPGYWTFHKQERGNFSGSLDLIGKVEAKLLVLQGPMLTETFSSLWSSTLAELSARGTRVLLLGAGLFRFTAAEVSAARAFVRSSGISAMVTRDSDTFEALGADVPLSHNGIDSAFFTPDSVPPVGLRLDPYYCFTFDRYPEPDIALGRGPMSRVDASFDFAEKHWNLRIPRASAWFAKRGKAQAYLGHMLDRRRLPTVLNGHEIVRLEHRTNPHLPWKVYKHGPAVASDEPYTYLSVYSGTALTLSDRVHACVATLAYGNPARLFTPSPRARLFDRLGLSAIRERPMTLPSRVLEGAKREELEFLRGIRGELGV